MTVTSKYEFDEKYDALIVGARAAGAATALLLASQGLKVLAIDRQAYGSDTISTHALMRGAVIQLTRWGLLDEIIKAGTPAVRYTTFYYGDEAIGLDIKPEYGANSLFAPRRTVLDRVLVDGARRAGAHIYHGGSLRALDFDPDGRVTGASFQDAEGNAHSIKADIVIGADGRRSTVADLVNAQTYRRSEYRTSAIYGYLSGITDEGFRWYYRPGVSVGAIPTNAGETCVFVSLPPERLRREIAKGSESLFETILAETSPDFAREAGRASRPDRLRRHPGENGFFRQSFGPGWALVGDAGFFKDPLTAHGITDALRDAELLAAAVNDASMSAFKRYQDERDALSQEHFNVTDAIASFNWDLDTVKDHHRRLSKTLKVETAAIAARAAA